MECCVPFSRFDHCVGMTKSRLFAISICQRNWRSLCSPSVKPFRALLRQKTKTLTSYGNTNIQCPIVRPTYKPYKSQRVFIRAGDSALSRVTLEYCRTSRLIDSSCYKIWSSRRSREPRAKRRRDEEGCGASNVSISALIYGGESNTR